MSRDRDNQNPAVHGGSINFQSPFYQDQIRAQTCVDAFRPLAEMGKPKDEKDLQAACEKILVRAGYHRLTPDNIVNFSKMDIAGWFGHMISAPTNPIFPDLIIFNRDMTRTLCVELKVNKKFSKAQKAMCTQKLWHLCWTVEEFEHHLAAWIGGKKE
jgi:hypothetical protein